MSIVTKIPELLSKNPAATTADAQKWIQDNGEWLKKVIEQHTMFIKTAEIPKFQAAYDGVLDVIEERDRARGDDVNHKLQVNYAQLIIDTVVDYMLGKPIVWTVEDMGGEGEAKAPETLLEEYRKDILALLRSEGGQRILAEQLRQGGIAGYSPIICWVDEEGEIDYEEYPVQEVIPVFDGRGRMKLAIRYYMESVMGDGNEITRTKVEVYDGRYVSYFIGDETGLSFVVDDSETATGNPIEHKAGRLPVSFFFNGTPARHEKRKLKAGVSDLGNGVMTLLEDYASALSDKANTVDRLLDQYLVLTNVNVDENEVMKMRRARAIALKNEKSTAGYIAQSQDDTAIENYLTRLVDTFHQTTFTPQLSDISGTTATEIKVKYAQLDIKAGKKEIYFTAAIKNLIAILTDLLNAKRLTLAGLEEGIHEILAGKAPAPSSTPLYNSEWLHFTLNRNLPQNFLEISQIVGLLTDKVPDAYLYELLWFIEDPVEALKEMKQQRKDALATNPLFAGAGAEFNSTDKPEDKGGTKDEKAQKPK